MKKYHCERCGEEKSRQGNICRKCYLANAEEFALRGKEASNYIDGRNKHKYYCIDCGTEVCDMYTKRCRSCAQKGKNNSGYIGVGNRLQDKKYYCKCGEEISYKTALYSSGKCNVCAMKEYGLQIREENHPNYIENLIREYPLTFNDELKSEVRDRDEHTCQNPDCGCTEQENGQALEVHHIDYDKNNNIIENLISLCKSCHMKTNAHREYWKKLFKNLIQKLLAV